MVRDMGRAYKVHKVELSAQVRIQGEMLEVGSEPDEVSVGGAPESEVSWA